MDTPAAPLARKLYITRKELLEALSGTDFYVEWLAIAAVLLLAGFIAMLLRRNIKRHLEKHPPRRIDTVFITKPLRLLAPLLTLLGLSLIKSPMEEYYNGGLWTAAMTQLCIAYLLAKCVVLVVRTRAIGFFIAVVIMVTALLDITGFMPAMASYLDSIAFEIGKFKLSMLNLIHGVVILIIVFWLAHLSSSTLESYLRRSSSLSYTARELTVKFFRLFVYFIALIVTLSAVGVDLTAFAVFGGALGVGIGLGLQKLTSNFVSGITLLLEKSVKIGDLIEVGGLTGWVRELNIRYTLIETADGRELMIPNEELVSTRVTSWTYSHNKARVEIPVTVAYDSDVDEVSRLLLEAAREHPLCLKQPAADCWLREFGGSGLSFLLVFWVQDVRQGRMAPQSAVMSSILKKFRAHDIAIPVAPHEVSLEKKI